MPPATLETLPNGLRMVFAPNSSAESVSFGLFVASGSRHEPAKVAGISHFIEHMLFKGTDTRTAREINRAIEGRGGSFNACTSEEGTVFYAHMPHEWLRVAVTVIADMYLNAAIPEDEFQRERQVVLQEIKMYADEPDSVAAERLSECLFPGNPVGAPIAGSEASLQPLTPADLRAYIRKGYVPAATVAVVVGNFDPSEARELIAAELGSARRGRALGYRKFDNRLAVVKESKVAKDVNQAQLAMGWRLPFGTKDPTLERRRYALTVLDALMGRSMSSRLFEQVREKRGLSYDIHSQGQLFDETGAWAVSGGTDPGRGEAMLGVVLREVEKLRTKKVGAAELRRTKEYLEGHFRMGLERNVSRLFYYGSGVLGKGRIIPPEEVVAGIEAVKAEEILALAHEYLVPERLAISWVVPK